MFKQIFSFFWGTSSEETTPLPLDEAYNVISECQDTLPVKTPEPEEIGVYEVLNKTGKITHADGNTYVVDGHTFESFLEDVTIGTKISYQLIKSSGEVRVVDVRVLENDWDVAATGKRQWHSRTLICKVDNRKGRTVTLTPGNIQVDLNNTQSDFIPIEGDWVELDVKCELDETIVDLNGKVIEITRLQPVRPHIKTGRVTHWNPQQNSGIMDKTIFFDKDSLYCGYFPVQGDKVAAEIIESNQGSCTWRALKIIPDYLQVKDTPKTREIHSEIQDTHPLVTITDNVNLTFTKLGEAKLCMIEIESQEEVELVCVELPRVNGQCRLCDAIDHYSLKANQPLTIRLECKAKTFGDSREVVVFHFKDFKMKRWITFQVASNHQNGMKERPLKSHFVVARDKRETIKGQRLSNSARFVPMRMPDFAVPERLLNLVTKYRRQPGFGGVNLLKNELEKMKPCLVTTLNYMNFEDRFHTLLHLDEIHIMMEMQKYDRERACFIKSGEFLMLEIENLAEQRPSLIQGDRVIARSLTDSKSPDYEGIIHKVGKNHAYIKFSPLFHNSYNGEDYSTYIIASRVTYRRKHFAVNLAVRNLGKDWLFPTSTKEKEPQLDFLVDDYIDSLNTINNELNLLEFKPQNVIGKRNLLEKIQKFQQNPEEKLPVRKLEWYNKSLNFYQKEAVRNILLGVCRPLPYIIFGPPGTGKTVTVVETVLQILRLMPHSRILLAAPSNSAADLLALRLIETGVLKPGDLIRLVAVTAVGNVPAKLAPYCATANVEKEGTETSLPVVTTSGLVLGYSSSVLGRHRITVCTCSSAGLLYTMGFSKGHFSHIIVDEAGQTSEPSVLIPLAFLDTSSGQAILAGDPMQLGPVVLSRIACEYGLEESFLERMVARFPYMRDSQGFPTTCGYDPRLLTKLIYNYRSLPVLLKLPSVLFYNDELKPTVSETDSKEAELLQKLSDILPKTKEGKVGSITFHGVVGDNFQNEDSPSWYNPSEASQVFYYVNELYRLGMTARDIGVITPYKAQIRQVMELFKEADFDLPKVGTVEEFQGQEFNVIILSTVRSTKQYVSCDIKHSLGFIASPRRLNVAISRAKSLLIIIGNPNVLSSDRCWRSVIKYCSDNDCIVGCKMEYH